MSSLRLRARSHTRSSFVAVVFCASLFAACGDDTAPPAEVDAGAVADARVDAPFDIGTPDLSSCVDDDGDGHRSSACGGDDCDDANAARYPTASEVCNAGIDDDCNGLADAADGVCVPCGPGLSGLDTMCVDIDECLMGVCGAAVGATCNNTRGSYECTCPAGYAAPPSGGTCADVDDECMLATDDCDDSPAATCMDTVASFTCTCPASFPFGTGHGASGCLVRFTDLGDGTVRDNNESGLEWQQGFSLTGGSVHYPGLYTQAGAVTYCASLTLDGGGWRLPTIDELRSIADTSRFSPAIDTSFFPGTPSPSTRPDVFVQTSFWSSSSVAGMPSQWWNVNFDYGIANFFGGSGSLRVRCVR